MHVHSVHVALGANWQRVLPVDIKGHIDGIITGLDLKCGAGNICNKSIHSTVHYHVKVDITNKRLVNSAEQITANGLWLCVVAINYYKT